MGEGHGHHDHEHAHDHGAPSDRGHAGHDHAGHDHAGHDHAGHDHGGHDHHHDLRETPLKRLIGAFTITAGFMFVEAGVGWWTHSLALLADAGHMLADAAALALAIVAQRIAAQARTRARTYGHRRAEVLAAFGNGVALAVTAIWIFIEAVQRWREPVSIEAGPMTITAVIGLFVNIASAMMLGLGQKGHNMNTRGALAHVLTDALGSVAAIAAGVLVMTLGWTRADPALSAVIGVLVLWGGYRLVRETTRVLMEGSPVEIDIADVEKTICSVEGVAALHDLHVWSISDGFNVLTVHVVLKSGFHGVEVALAVVRRLREVHKIDHATVQPEPARSEQLIALRIPPRNRPAA